MTAVPSRTGALATGLALLSAATFHAQQPTATFRSSADYIEVSVQAFDRSGRPVMDLKPDDLQLFEDGKPQEIATFASINTPIEHRQAAQTTRAALPPAETARVTNATAREGRTFVLFVDAMHIAAERTFAARRVLKNFVLENMGDNDEAAVVITGGLTRSQDFTSDKGTLLAAIDRVAGDRLPGRILSKWRHKVDLPYDYVGDPYFHERAARAEQALGSLRRVVQMLTGLGGRRTAVLYFGEGLDLNLDDRIGRAGGPHQAGQSVGRTADPDDDYVSNQPIEAALAGQVADELQLTVEAASRANVTIYSVDPRGLADPTDDLIQVTGPPSGNSGEGNFHPSRAMRQELVRTQQFLRDLAGRTGGRAIVSTNYFAKPFETIMQDSSQYYLLTYRMAHRDDGRFHRISVRTSRPDVTLRTRDGYYSPRSGGAIKTARSPLAGLLESPIQLPGLTMSAASTVIPGPTGGTIRFAVEFDGASLQTNGDATPVIDVAYVVTDDDGHVLAQGEKSLRLAVSRQMRASLAGQGLRYVVDLSVPPGRRHVRFAARSRETQALGSLFWDVDVPAVPPADVAVSPLVLTSLQADTMPTISDVPRGAAPGDGLMTARRAFLPEDVLSISTLVANGRKADETLAAAFVVSTADGHEVARRDVTLPSSDGRSQLAAFSQRLGLDTFTPGQYRADFVVRSSNGRVRAERALLFEVRGGGHGHQAWVALWHPE